MNLSYFILYSCFLIKVNSNAAMNVKDELFIIHSFFFNNSEILKGKMASWQDLL